MADFLQLAGKRILIFGVANRWSIAYHVSRVLRESGAECIYSVRDQHIADKVRAIIDPEEHEHVYTCRVEENGQIAALRDKIAARYGSIFGIVHSIAWADYPPGGCPFHEWSKEAFFKSFDISAYSLVAIAREFRDIIDRQGAVVTLSIASPLMAAENYGLMAPIKAALEVCAVFLAKSFSRFSEVRFNVVAAGLVRTTAAAGIPGFTESYLYAEQIIPRRRALEAEEVANVVCFLLSPRSSGINGQRVVVDAGLGFNFFDDEIIRRVLATSNQRVRSATS
ncbi:MAG: SDR family oxidoreductase [Thermoguttaceae bacterium]|nr:SDR family oxidoreductase [Thermoguttaceae bacterium]MDW8077587.1 SDR family oxidoreductase [Thermoguttaceae bacterium]